jgi:hemolysin D
LPSCAGFGHVDIVVTATGKIIPSVRTKVIQPFETGVVRAIHVHDGQEVKAGDVLIELDSTMNAAESAHLRADLISAKLDVARLTAALAETGDPTESFHPPADAPSALVATQLQFLVQQVAEHRAKLAALNGQRQQKGGACHHQCNGWQAIGGAARPSAAGRYPADAL